MVDYVFVATAIFGVVSFTYYTLNSFMALRYKSAHKKAAKLADASDLTIVVPVYNEEEKAFKRCISSVAAQGAHFIVVGDSSLEPYKSITEENGGRFIFLERNVGKRKAIAEGIKEVSTKYVMFVDSDTSISRNAARSMLSMFDDKVGGVGCRISIRKRRGWISYSAEFFERLKEVTFKAMSYAGTVMVLDGRCAAYRTELIRDFMQSEEYRNNSFMGKPSNLAEDRHITSYVSSLGYRTVIDYDAVATTEPQKSPKMFFRQMVRWSRAGYFYFFKEVADGSYFKKGPFYAFEMLYIYVFPIAIIALALARFDVYLSHGLVVALAIESARASRLLTYGLAGMSPEILFYMWIEIVGFIGTLVFGTAVGVTILRKKKRTMIMGGIALLMLFAASMYGLASVYKQDKWLTR